MQLDELMQENKALRIWYHAFEKSVGALAAEGFPQIVAGWGPEDRGLDHDAYIDACKDMLDELEAGADADLPTFDDWKMDKREDSDDLGFCASSCDLCRLPVAGDRYAMTALPPTPCGDDWKSLRVCTDCYFYAVYGDLPDL